MTSPVDRRALAELKRRIDLAGLIGRDVALKKRGREWVGLSPFNREKTPSFTVVPRKGFWHCFSSGKHGDAVGWMIEVRGLRFVEAVRELAQLHGFPLADLGLAECETDTVSRGTDTVRPAARKTRRACRPGRNEVEALARASKLKRAEKIWRQASPAGGTAVERYLQARGIDLPAPPSLRFADLPHPAREGASGPAMVAIMQNGAGRFAGVHRTWLHESLPEKASVHPNRMMLGAARGACVRLCPPTEHLYLAEGIETALSVMQACGLPCWAVLSRGNFQHFEPPADCMRVTNLADNDTKDWRAARRVMRRAADAQAERGLTVETAWPPRGTDFNDLLVGAA